MGSDDRRSFTSVSMVQYALVQGNKGKNKSGPHGVAGLKDSIQMCELQKLGSRKRLDINKFNDIMTTRGNDGG